MNLPEMCIRRPVMTTLLTLATVIFGWFSHGLLSVSALPKVEFPTIVVTALLPGTNPESMASAVALPLEKQFSTISGVDSIVSSSTLGQTQITLQFSLDRSIDAAALDVQAAISVAQRKLPVEMTTPPSFRKINPADTPIILLALRSTTLPLSSVNEYAETIIAPRLSTLPGVAQLLVYGQQKSAVRVQVDPVALTARGLSLDDIQKALSTANSNTPTGMLNTERQAITLQATGQLTQADDYEPLVVAWRNGAPVRLGEVAKIIDSVENNRIANWTNSQRSLVLAVQKQPEANTVAVADAVKALVPSFASELPAAIEMQVLIDRSVSIRDSVHDVQFTLGLTIALVVLVIFLFLRSLTATIIPAVVLPVSLIGTFAAMYLMDFSINNLTLMAITLAVGFVVDDAIVMLENIVRHTENGEGVMEAAFKGSREIAFTIVSITLSLVAAFIPLLFMGGVIGRLFREFAVTICVAILVSGVVSLTLTPLMCSRILKPSRPGKHEESGHFFLWLLRFYEMCLDRVLKHRFATLLVTIGTVVATVWLVMTIPKGFFPTEDTGLISVITEANEDISFPAMVERHTAAAAIIGQDPDVAVVNAVAGAGGPNPATNTGRMFIGLKPLGVRKDSVTDVIQRLRRKVSQLPGIAVFFQPVQNIQFTVRPAKNLYQYVLQAAEPEALYHWAPILEKRLRQVPGLQDLSSDLQIKSPIAFIDIDREKAATLGITSEQLRGTLFSAFGTRQVSTIYTPSNDYQVILEVDPAFQTAVGDLSQLYMRSSTGKLVPLDAFATIRSTVGPSTVSHQGQRPVVTLSFNLTPGTALGQAVDGIKEAQKDIGLPPTITTGFFGTAQFFQQSLKGQGLLITAAILVVYIVLGILYESFIHPITILSGLPAAAVGALLTLMLFRLDLSVIAIIGIVLLIGIVKKNAIMMIDFAIERQREGHEPFVAIREACLLRFRPIMMTTMAALMGALPIALGLGAGAELRQPLGLAVVGGLVVSQALTLFITPVIYLYLENIRHRVPNLRLWRRAQPQPGE